jgi:hypothetical protein
MYFHRFRGALRGYVFCVLGGTGALFSFFFLKAGVSSASGASVASDKSGTPLLTDDTDFERPFSVLREGDGVCGDSERRFLSTEMGCELDSIESWLRCVAF